jgi:hypothetical protein
MNQRVHGFYYIGAEVPALFVGKVGAGRATRHPRSTLSVVD